MAYKQLQFLAYVLDTAPHARGPGSSFYPGLDEPHGDSRHDIAARCALMARAIDTAAAAPNLGAADTLKIFMVPELAFRGANGAYDGDGVRRVVAALAALVAGERWADWLFVFGSIVGWRPAPEGSADPRGQAGHFTLVQRGGPAHAGAAGGRLVARETRCHIDFISKARLALRQPPAPVRPGLLLRENLRHTGLDSAGTWSDYDGAGVFTSDGFRFGLQAFGEPDGAPLLAPGWSGRRGQVEVQVQLAPSCGMRLGADLLALAADGYGFYNDGAGRGATVLRRGALSTPPCLCLAVDGAALAVEGAGLVDAAALYCAGYPPFAGAGQGVRPLAGRPDPGSAAGAVVVYDSLPAPGLASAAPAIRELAVSV